MWVYPFSVWGLAALLDFVSLIFQRTSLSLITFLFSFTTLMMQAIIWLLMKRYKAKIVPICIAYYIVALILNEVATHFSFEADPDFDDSHRVTVIY